MTKITFLSLLFLAGCGGSAKLTCEYLEDPKNCWARAAAAAKACLPDDADTGVLEAGRAVCSFTDGTRIVFDDPLPNDTMDLERFGFTIETDGSDCARFLDTFANRLELEAGGYSVVSQLHPGHKFELDCGDKSYTSDYDLLFECASGSQPVDGFEVTPDLVYFTIISVSTPGELFRCTP
jgi:hypothetical protein